MQIYLQTNKQTNKSVKIETNSFRLQGWDKINCLALVFIHDLCIDLRSAHIGVVKKFGEEACRLQQLRWAIPHRAARDRLCALLDLPQCRQTERSLIQISVITEMDNVPAVQPGLARLLLKLGD